MKIYILIDDPKSWFMPYGIELKKKLINKKNEVYLIQQASEEYSGDICFMLSCIHLVSKKFLSQFQHCIVVHASDLPQGKGFSPLQWQILEGKNEIVLTLIEVDEQADHGPYYLKNTVSFDGHELLPDLRRKMAQKIIKMCLYYVGQYDTLTAKQQEGEESIYRRRNAKDDEIDINKSIKEQWNHLRTADNQRHPLWFEYMGHKYILKIERET